MRPAILALLPLLAACVAPEPPPQRHGPTAAVAPEPLPANLEPAPVANRVVRPPTLFSPLKVDNPFSTAKPKATPPTTTP